MNQNKSAANLNVLCALGIVIFSLSSPFVNAGECASLLLSSEFKAVEAVLLETPRLWLRPATRADRDAFVSIWINYEVTRAENLVRSLRDIEQEFDGKFFPKLGVDPSYPLLRMIVEKQSGRLLGCISAVIGEGQSGRFLIFGYALLPQYWRQKFMSEALTAFLRHMETVAQIGDFYANVFSNNFGSRRILEKAGFTMHSSLHNLDGLNRVRTDVELLVYHRK